MEILWHCRCRACFVLCRATPIHSLLPFPSPSLLYLAAAFSFISLSLSTAMQLRGNILKISGSAAEYATRGKVEVWRGEEGRHWV